MMVLSSIDLFTLFFFLYFFPCVCVCARTLGGREGGGAGSVVSIEWFAL